MCNNHRLTTGKINLIRPIVKQATWDGINQSRPMSIIYQPIWKQYVCNNPSDFAIRNRFKYHT
jgi:hypothetical protein